MSNPFEAPQHGSSLPHRTPAAENAGDATGGVIPYKNPAALTAYYLGIFGMFPCLGLALSIPAFVLGIIGLQKRKQNPHIKGSVHAWIGIILGGLFSIAHIVGWVVVVIGLMSDQS